MGIFWKSGRTKFGRFSGEMKQERSTVTFFNRQRMLKKCVRHGKIFLHNVKSLALHIPNSIQENRGI